MMNWTPQVSQPVARRRAAVENAVVSVCPTVPLAVMELALVTVTRARTLVVRPVRVVAATAPRGPPYLPLTQAQPPLPLKVAVFSWEACDG